MFFFKHKFVNVNYTLKGNTVMYLLYRLLLMHREMHVFQIVIWLNTFGNTYNKHVNNNLTAHLDKVSRNKLIKMNSNCHIT